MVTDTEKGMRADTKIVYAGRKTTQELEAYTSNFVWSVFSLWDSVAFSSYMQLPMPFSIS